MNFKQFCNTQESFIDKDIEQKDVNNSSSNNTYKTNIDKNFVSDKFEQYSKYSQAELMQEFIKESAKAKTAGVYDDNKIEQIKSVLFPFLSNEQKQYFENLIGMVK